MKLYKVYVVLPSFNSESATAAISGSCVATTIPRRSDPAAHFRQSAIALPLTGSRLLVGSSSSRNGAPEISAQANSARLYSPDDSRPG